MYSLTGERITQFFFFDGTRDVIRDSWLGDSAFRELDKPWTGCTYFPLAGSQPPKQPDADEPEVDELWFFAGWNGTSKGSFYLCDVRVVFTVYAPHLPSQV